MIEGSQTKTACDQLICLAETNIDAILAYDQAIEQIEEDDIREDFSDFRDEHVKHVSNLGSCIRDLGGEPPSLARDHRGFTNNHMTSLEGIRGTKTILLAMEANESLLKASYRATNSDQFSEDVTRLLERNYEDEAAHLAYIQDLLKSRFESVA